MKYVIFAIENRQWLHEFNYSKIKFSNKKSLGDMNIAEYIQMKNDIIFNELKTLDGIEYEVISSTVEIGLEQVPAKVALSDMNYMIYKTPTPDLLMTKVREFDFDGLSYSFGVDYILLEVSEDICNTLHINKASTIDQYVINDDTIDYSKLHPKELKKILTYAKHNNNIDLINKISKYVNENKHIKLYEDFILLRK